MKKEYDEALEVAEDLKRKLTDSTTKNGAERQMIRDLCRQQLADLTTTLNVTRDDREAISEAIDKDENHAITLIDRVLEYYRN